MDADYQFAYGERLADIVSGSELKAADDILCIGTGGQEQYRNSRAALPQFPDKGISVHNRHHDIGHDIGHYDLRTEIRHSPETVGSVSGASYLESLFRECF